MSKLKLLYLTLLRLKMSKILKHAIKIMKKNEISMISIKDFSDLKFGFDYNVIK